jgi:hypothetical protein
MDTELLLMETRHSFLQHIKYLELRGFSSLNEAMQSGSKPKCCMLEKIITMMVISSALLLKATLVSTYVLSFFLSNICVF